jgi:hypothetical protein
MLPIEPALVHASPSGVFGWGVWPAVRTLPFGSALRWVNAAWGDKVGTGRVVAYTECRFTEVAMSDFAPFAWLTGLSSPLKWDCAGSP